MGEELSSERDFTKSKRKQSRSRGKQYLYRRVQMVGRIQGKKAWRNVKAEKKPIWQLNQSGPRVRPLNCQKKGERRTRNSRGQRTARVQTSIDISKEKIEKRADHKRRKNWHYQ